MKVLEGLTPEIRSVVRQFCSHPAADAQRKAVVEWKLYSVILPEEQTYPDANAFYMYYFTMKKLTEIMTAMGHVQALIGADVRISELALRPKFRTLCEEAFPTYFEDVRGPRDFIFRDYEDWMSEANDDLETY